MPSSKYCKHIVRLYPRCFTSILTQLRTSHIVPVPHYEEAPETVTHYLMFYNKFSTQKRRLRSSLKSGKKSRSQSSSEIANLKPGRHLSSSSRPRTDSSYLYTQYIEPTHHPPEHHSKPTFLSVLPLFPSLSSFQTSLTFPTSLSPFPSFHFILYLPIKLLFRRNNFIITLTTIFQEGHSC